MQRSSNPTPFVAVGVAIVLILLGLGGRELYLESQERQAKIAKAKEMVEECRNCPEDQLPEMLHRVDPWGNDLMVKYHDGFVKSVTIISLGPDGKIDTKDDITSSRHVKLDWKKAGEGLGEVGGDISQGIWRGLKRSFAGDEEKDKK